MALRNLKLPTRRRFRMVLPRLCIFLVFLALIATHSLLLHFLPVDNAAPPATTRLLVPGRGAMVSQEPPSSLSLTPMWTCSDPSALRGRPAKLVFVHIFKTAGMTMRELLLRYALACHAGIGLVSECSGLAPTHDNSTTWTNGFGSKKGKPCRMKAINRNQQTLPNLQVDDSALNEFDILAGHLPLGVGSLWGENSMISTPGLQPRIQYLSFFRNAIDKFVSGVMYQKKEQNYSFEAIIELIQKRVKGELKQQKYREGYSAYLLTPQQKQQHYSDEKQQSTSVAARTQQVLQNLDNENVLVGIVERMSESLELLQFVIDGDKEQTPLFQSFGMQTGPMQTSNKGEDPALPGKKNNPSKFSTSSVVEELKKDPDFEALLNEYVKYDDQIYRHALKIHEAQLLRIQSPEKVS